MLTNLSHCPVPAKPRAKQAGVVLIIALIVLVAMTLAGLALMRSVDTSNLIAGNMAFQQAATHSGDAGVETAFNWLQTKTATQLGGDDQSNGYSATGSDAPQNPVAGQPWDDYWAHSLTTREVKLNNGAPDAAGNQVAYVIDRMCGGAPVSCVASPVVTTTSKNDEDGNPHVYSSSVVYYRITVRIAGPRNTVSYVQAMISM